jgi:hypothetical protein
MNVFAIVGRTGRDIPAKVVDETLHSDRSSYLRVELYALAEHSSMRAYVIADNTQIISKERAEETERQLAENGITSLSQIGEINDVVFTYKMPKPRYSIEMVTDTNQQVYYMPDEKQPYRKHEQALRNEILEEQVLNVLFQDKNWIFVEYPADNTTWRGYIPKYCIPEIALQSVEPLPQSTLQAKTNDPSAYITLDPTLKGRQSDQEKLGNKQDLTIFGFQHIDGLDWAYVQQNKRHNNTPPRGYVLIKYLQLFE